MPRSYMLGFLIGFVAAIAAATVVALLFRKFGARKCQYDERQQAARGRAFRTAFFTLAALVLANGVFATATGRRLCDDFTAAFIALGVAVTVFAIQCIMRDAYLSVAAKPGFTIALFSLVAVLNLALGAFSLARGEVVADGMLTYHAANLVCGGMFLAIVPALVIRRLSAGRGAGEGDGQ